jgi:flagellar basal body-associated protein FliL
MKVEAKGVDSSGQVIDLYAIVISRGMRISTWIILVVAVVIIISVLTCAVLLCLSRRQHVVTKKKGYREPGQEMEQFSDQ